MNEPVDRHPSTAARISLADRLSLTYHDSMQDWEWEVAAVDRFDEFLALFGTPLLTDDERFSLMEILIQCVEEMPTEEEFSRAWSAVESYLLQRPELHSTTVRYWARATETDEGACFRVSGNMRRLYALEPHAFR